MRWLHSCHDDVIIVGSAWATYIPPQTSTERFSSSLPRSLCVPPCRRFASVNFGSALPSSGAVFFPRPQLLRLDRRPSRPSRRRDPRSALLTHPCAGCMAVMWLAALLEPVDIAIFVPVDVTRPVSSSLGSRLRQPDRTPLLLPGARSTGEWRFLLPRPFATTSDLGSALIIQAPSSDGAFFLCAAQFRRPSGQFAENAWQTFLASVCARAAAGR